jgi:hypothetical protein
MSMPSRAYIRQEIPFCLLPPKPKKLVSFSRDGGNNDIPNWKRPYPKETAAISLSIVALSIWEALLEVWLLGFVTGALLLLTLCLSV